MMILLGVVIVVVIVLIVGKCVVFLGAGHWNYHTRK